MPETFDKSYLKIAPQAVREIEIAWDDFEDVMFLVSNPRDEQAAIDRVWEFITAISEEMAEARQSTSTLDARTGDA